MMMLLLTTTLTVFSLLLLGFVAISLWRMRQLTQHLLTLQQLHQPSATQIQKLSQKVDTIHQAIHGVSNSLQTVDSQVQHLNVIAGQWEAMHQYDDIEIADYEDSEDGASSQSPNGMPQMMIEIRHRSSDGEPGERQLVRPEDMSPEMRSKFAVFQTLYKKILFSDQFPPPAKPELN